MRFFSRLNALFLFGCLSAACIPENRRDILFAVKIAWSRQMEGDEAYNAHEDDAYV